jgi:hypothetical protein
MPIYTLQFGIHPSLLIFMPFLSDNKVITTDNLSKHELSE